MGLFAAHCQLHSGFLQMPHAKRKVISCSDTMRCKALGRAVSQVICTAEVPARTPHQPISIPKDSLGCGGTLGTASLPVASSLPWERKKINHGIESSFLLFASPSIPESPWRVWGGWHTEPQHRSQSTRSPIQTSHDCFPWITAWIRELQRDPHKRNTKHALHLSVPSACFSPGYRIHAITQPVSSVPRPFPTSAQHFPQGCCWTLALLCLCHCSQHSDHRTGPPHRGLCWGVTYQRVCHPR